MEMINDKICFKCLFLGLLMLFKYDLVYRDGYIGCRLLVSITKRLFAVKQLMSYFARLTCYVTNINKYIL